MVARFDMQMPPCIGCAAAGRANEVSQWDGRGSCTGKVARGWIHDQHRVVGIVKA